MEHFLRATFTVDLVGEARGEISSGTVESLNNKIRVVTRRSYAFRTCKAMKMALYYTGPEPESTQDSAEEAQTN